MKSLQALFLSIALGLIAAAPLASNMTEFKFEDPKQAKIFQELTEELRCLVCQNESLAGSRAELAQDLRREVYEMMQEGKNKEEIINFLVARYGDFVLYSPPLKPSTYPLWFGPFIFIAIAAFFLARTLLRKKKTRDEAISDEEQARLDALLNKTAQEQDVDRDNKS